jgi:N4-gp56 family major capsid protein
MGATFNNPVARIGKLKGEILAHAVPVEVLGITGQQRMLPKNQSDTVVYRRWLPFGATTSAPNSLTGITVASHVLQEGITPAADSLVPQDITVTIQQFGALYSLTDKMADLYEDDVPMEMKKQVGERMGMLREMIRWGVLKGGTNVYYQGGSSRAAVADKVKDAFLQKISRNLQANHAKRVTGILAPSQNIATKPVEASYLIFGHTDLEADFRALTNFKVVAEYGSRQPIHEQELGSFQNFRVILSPELASIPDAGAAVGATGMYSTTGANIDVYPIIVCGEDAWGQLTLRGPDSIDPTYIAPGEKTKDDPLGQRGYVGAKFYMNCVRTNEGWMAVGEVGATAL